jgi:hypothetical protein
MNSTFMLEFRGYEIEKVFYRIVLLLGNGGLWKQCR